MTIYAPTLAIDMVAPESAAPYLAIAAEEGAKRTLTPREIDDMRYRVAWAFEHGAPNPVKLADLLALLAMVPA